MLPEDHQARFLDRLRAATADAESQLLPWESFLAPQTAPSKTIPPAAPCPPRNQTLLDQLLANAALLEIQTHLCPSLAAVDATITRIALASTPEFASSMALLLHHHPLLAALPLALLESQGIKIHRCAGLSAPAIRARTLEASIGVTVADLGLAESATLVQLTRPGRPRSTSLVPSIHLALLPLSRLVADLVQALAWLRSQPNVESTVFITGASKTADIEGHMVHGAHGPRNLHLLVLTNEPSLGPPG